MNLEHFVQEVGHKELLVDMVIGLHSHLQTHHVLLVDLVKVHYSNLVNYYFGAFAKGYWG